MKKVSFEQAWELVFNELSRPSMENKTLKELHDRMLQACARQEPKAKNYVKAKILLYLQKAQLQVENYTQNEAVENLFREMYGFGAIDELINDPLVQEITVNGPDNIWFEKDGLKQKAQGLRFHSEKALMRVIDRCMGYTAKEINRQKAFGQTTMADGSRITITIPPIAKVPYINYRKFNVFIPTEENYIDNGTFTKEALEVLKLFPKYRANIMIIGSQNSGKTTLLSFLTDYYPDNFRIGVLESPEFETTVDVRRPGGNVFMLRADETTGVTLLDIFKHALRFSADVLVIPEARGEEMEEVIKANRRGSAGTITTMHSISSISVVDDIAQMFTESGKNYRPEMLKDMIAKSLDIIVTFRHMDDGKRRVVEIAEVDWDEENQRPLVKTLFDFNGDTLRRTDQTLTDELVFRMCAYGADLEQLAELGLVKI